MATFDHVHGPQHDEEDFSTQYPRPLIDPTVRVSHPIVERSFGGFLQPRDPTDLIGTALDSFTINTNLTLAGLERFNPSDLRADIYHAVDNAVRSDYSGTGVTCEIADYNDAKVQNERSRRYFAVRLNTTRDTTVTTLFRCFVAGENFYLATNSYLLRRIRWTFVVGQALLSAFVFVASIMNPLAWLPAAAYFWWAWADVVRAARFGDMTIGLRARYPRPLRDSTFDIDDTLMFLKSALPLMVDTIDQVLHHYGFTSESGMDVLRDIRDNVMRSKIEFHNSQGGIMQFIGSNIGGRGNTAKA